MKRVLLVGALLISSVNMAAAQSEAEIRAKISRLKAEIEALEKQLPKPKPSRVDLAMANYKRPIEEGQTGDYALLCTSPLAFNDAHAAIQSRDEGWLKSLGCITARSGIPIRVIERNSLGWKVRLQPPGGEGVTLWAYSALSLRGPSGETLDYDGRPIANAR